MNEELISLTNSEKNKNIPVDSSLMYIEIWIILKKRKETCDGIFE